jgi:phage shock protein PspC (stress-responsive transcriptional regulator)
MQKVITINLNGNAYQLEEPGYDALHRYLSDAAGGLADNPDRAEILDDLEQAMAERCRRYLSSGKTVVPASEIERILTEIGPVDAAAVPRSVPGAAPHRLYQIREGAMISGVCNGLGAYFNIDPTFVRIAFLLTAFFHGAGVLAYLLLMLLVPYAKTSDELAAQGGNSGLPSRVQRFVEKLREKLTTKPWERKKTA